MVYLPKAIMVQNILYDQDKILDIVLLELKSDVYIAFQLFQQYYKRGDHQICRFYTDYRGKYSSQAFTDHSAKYGII